MWPPMCIHHCFTKGYYYAGLQNRYMCFCGNSYGKYGSSNSCNQACYTRPRHKCGGITSNSVYTTGLSKSFVSYLPPKNVYMSLDLLPKIKKISRFIQKEIQMFHNVKYQYQQILVHVSTQNSVKAIVLLQKKIILFIITKKLLIINNYYYYSVVYCQKSYSVYYFKKYYSDYLRLLDDVWKTYSSCFVCSYYYHYLILFYLI